METPFHERGFDPVAVDRAPLKEAKSARLSDLSHFPASWCPSPFAPPHTLLDIAAQGGPGASTLAPPVETDGYGDSELLDLESTAKHRTSIRSTFSRPLDLLRKPLATV